MKTNLIVILMLSLIAYNQSKGQDVNFRALDNATHLVSLHGAVDYGSSYGIGYGYVWHYKSRPVVIGTEFSQPFGNEMLDDWKWKTSVQAELWRKDHFSVVLKPAFVWKHYESRMLTAQNFGADFGLHMGLIKPKWGIVAIADYEKYITSRLKHHLLKEYYPGIKDGWYDQSGGNFKFGARFQKSFGTWNTFVTVGKHFGADFKDNPTLPFFAEISIQKQF
jgi:hypothetical protein